MIVNTINDKVYIGLTSKTIEERFKEHANRAKNNSNTNRPLYIAIRKYGIDNFYICSLETVKTKKEASEKEIYWVDIYDSFNNGYNATRGGLDGSCHSKSVLKISIDNFSILREFESTHEAGKSLGKANSQISKACSEDSTGKVYGYYWIYKDVYEKLNITLEEYFKQKDKHFKNKNAKCRKIVQIDAKTNNVIKEYSSVTSAAKDTGLSYKYIYRVCRGERKTYKNFIWKFI